MSFESHRIAEEPYSRDVRDRSSYCYLLYGHTLRSQWQLPFVECAETDSPAIELAEGSPGPFLMADRETAHEPVEDWFQYSRLADGSAYLRWPGLYAFLISRDGRRIFGRTTRKDISPESFHSYLLGVALSFSLLKLGFDPLHATVVATNGSAFGLLGRSGDGKSTLAGAFLQAGYPLVTDDLLVLKKESGGFAAYPGPPRIKLLPEVAKAVIGEWSMGNPMNPLTPKLIIPLSRNQAIQSTVPLKSFYVLNSPSASVRHERITIRRLSQRRALLALLKHSFNDWVSEPARLNLQFLEYSQIAARIPIKQLSYPRRLDRLPAVLDAILADLKG